MSETMIIRNEDIWKYDKKMIANPRSNREYIKPNGIRIRYFFRGIFNLYYFE